MKILALTPVNQNKIKLNSAKPAVFVGKNLSYDTVSFQGGAKKAAEKAGVDMFEGFLNNISGELGEKVKKLMSGEESRPVFMTMLISLAATATELILKNGPKTETVEVKPAEGVPVVADKDAVPEAETEKAQMQSAKKSGRKSIVDKMGEEAFVACLQDMVNKDFTYTQMGEALGGLSISSVSKYIKQYNIQKTVNTETSAEDNSAKPTRKTKEEKLAEFIKSKEFRQEYLKKLESYPELLAQYKRAMENIVSEPKNEFYSDSLAGMEKAFKNLFELKPKHNKPYLEQFNSQYGSNFDKVGVILNNITKDRTLPEVLAVFKDNDYSEDLINRWIKYPALNSCELEMIEELPLVNQQAVYDLKKGGAFSFNLVKNEKFHNYSFILKFAENVTLTEKLKTISAFHEALYDNIYLHKDKGTKIQRIVDIQDELQNHLAKDKNLDSIYNILKYVVPDEIAAIDYKTDKYIPVNKLETANMDVKNKMEQIIANLDTKSNAKLRELEDILNDNELFMELIDNNHAKLRFISRFVLNRRIKNDDLYESCSRSVGQLAKQLDKKLSNGCLIFPYIMNDSSAPSFYLDKCPLGDFIKITLNNQGQIHTIFEDIKRKSMAKN